MAFTTLHKGMWELEEFFTQCKKLDIDVTAVENSEISIDEWYLMLAPHEKSITGNILFFFLARLLLNKSYSSNVKMKAMETLRPVIAVTKIRHVKFFQELYSVVSTQVFNPKTVSIEQPVSEEMNEAVILTLTCILDNIDDETFSQVYDFDMYKVLSVGVVLGTALLRFSKSVKIRCLSLQLLLTMSQYNSNDDYRLKMASNVFLNFIPGLVIPCTDIICKEMTVHHSVLQLTVRAWCHVLYLTFRDIPRENEPVSDRAVVDLWISSTLKKPELYPTDFLSIFSVPKRTTRWIAAALEVLRPIIVRVAKRHNVLHESVRSEMIRGFYVLLAQCSDSLGQVAGPLLDALVGLSVDETPSVAEQAHQALLILFKKSIFITDLAQNQLPDVQKELALEKDMEKIALILPVMNGYFRIITQNPKESPCLIANPLLLPKLLNELKNLCSVQWAPQLMHESVGHPTVLPKGYVTWQSLLVFLNKKGLMDLREISKYICIESMESAVCLLIDDYNKKSMESLVFLTILLSKCSKLQPSISNKLIDFYLELNNSLDLYSETSPKKLQIKVIKIMLAMESLAHLAGLVQADNDNYLLRTLYYVVERMGSSFTSVRAFALISAFKIAKVLKFENLKQLIVKNIDYLSYHISVKLRKCYEVPMLDAIRVTAELCPSKTLPEIEHILQQLLSKSATNEYSTHVTFFLRIFKAFVECARIASEPDHDNRKPAYGISHDDRMDVDRTNEENHINEIDILSDPLKSHKRNVGVMLVNYIKKRENERLLKAGHTKIPTNDEAPNQTETPKPELPAYATIAIQVVRRCMHYLPSRTDMQKALCLEIMETGMKVIAQWEDEFLPLVHEVWSPLVLRFHSGSSPLVMHRSFQLLCTLAKLSTDFIRIRATREALPILREFLIKNASVSIVQSPFDQTFKLQKALLSELGHLVCHLNLQEREISMVVEAVAPYLCKNPNDILGRNASKSIQDLMDHDPYFIAYILTLRRQK